MSNDSVLYVQGVPEGVTSAQLEKAVTGAAKDVSKVNLHERKRFAHVVFSSHEAAEKGLKALKKASIGGQTLDFEWSKAKESSNTAEFDEANNSTIYIRGLSTKTAEDEVKTAFADYGEIERAFLVNDKKTKSSKGQAIIEFKTRASAEKALELNETELDGQTITVEFAKSGPRTNNSKGGRPASNGSAAKKPAQKRKADADEEEEKPAKKAKASETPKTAAKKETPKKEAAAATTTKKETPKKEAAATTTTPKKETPKKEAAAASPAKKETPKKAATPSKAKGKK